MADIINKLSSYNIFNYILPGTLFAGIGSLISSYTLIETNLLIAPFLYYFYGLIISRVGSLILEPLLKKLGFLKFATYENYVVALNKDKTLDRLSEENNMYRTLCSLLLVLGVLPALSCFTQAYPGIGRFAPYFGGLILLTLFLFSYRKQTSYISNRVSANINSKDS